MQGFCNPGQHGPISLESQEDFPASRAISQTGLATSIDISEKMNVNMDVSEWFAPNCSRDFVDSYICVCFICCARNLKCSEESFMLNQ